MPVAAMELGATKSSPISLRRARSCTAAQVQFELDHLAEYAKQQIMQE